jgi:D-glycero-D-manno-heptose 1,7-bisphosphate phosphatase
MSAQALATKMTEMFALQSSLNPALFLDRDGTVIVEKEFLSDPAGVELHSGVAEALRGAQSAGFRLVIVSNQSGVARGYFPESAVERVNQRVSELLEQAGVVIAGTYYCPNHPAGLVEEYRIRESGRKPADQMFITAARELQIDLRASWVIGDRRSDYLSAAPLGSRGALVKTGYGEKAATEGAISAPLGPEIIAADLPAAIREILSEECR